MRFVYFSMHCFHAVKYFVEVVTWIADWKKKTKNQKKQNKTNIPINSRLMTSDN